VSRQGSKKAESLAAELERCIVQRGWPIGESLGSEAELIDRYGVSRAVLREAIRIAEHHGAVRMRAGVKGGLIVTAPDAASVRRPATLFLDHADVTPENLLEVRAAIELSCVRLASERISPDSATRIRSVLERERRLQFESIETGQAHDFHVLLAELTGNAAMRLFVEILTGLTYERSGRAQIDSASLEQMHAAHEAIARAVISGNAELAERRMAKHLAAIARYYIRHGDGSN
jgi:DNA-binding FadR family transcriptional regulator